MAQIVKVPSAILTTPSKLVERVDKKTLTFIEQMKKTLTGAKNPKGVGLAAPQVGRSVRVFITRPQATTPVSVFINPEIIGTSKEKTKGVPGRDNKFEGCLSIPNVWGVVHRHHMVKLSFQTPNGRLHRRTFTGFIATIIQHEMDHINGILFTQRVLEQKNKLFKITGKDKEGNDVFEEIEI